MNGPAALDAARGRPPHRLTLENALTFTGLAGTPGDLIATIHAILPPGCERT